MNIQDGNIFLQVLLFLLAFGSILFLAYITTKLVAGKASRGMKGKYIDIIETVSLGVDKKIHLVKVDKQFVLIASSGKNIEFLTNVTLDNYEDQKKSEEENSVFDFKTFFEKYVQANKGRPSREKGKNEGRKAEADHVENSFGQNLSRLKALTGRLDDEKQKSGDENTNDNS